MTPRLIVKALLLGPVAVAAVLYAVANRTPVPIVLDPISTSPDGASVMVPLYAYTLAILAVGVVLGGVFTWLAQGKHRKAARRLRKEVEAAKTEAESLRAELEAARAAEPPRLSGLQGQGSATLGNSPALTAVLPPSPPRLLN